MKKKFIFIILSLIIFLSAFLRLYHIGDYQTFLGDEGRDVLVAKGILEGDFTLLGPRSSAGDFFMGPAYYYMITPFLWLFRYDPVGPAVMVALLSVATTWLIYFVGKRWFNPLTGLFASALYAVSPLVINYSHSSWNPDVLPFFALLSLYFLFQAVQAKHPAKLFVFVGFLLGIAIQLHYLALLLCFIAAVYTFASNWYLNHKPQIVIILIRYLQLFAGFVIGFAPFLLFEIRHGFPNTKSIMTFIFSDSAQKGYITGGTFFSTVGDAFFRIFGRLVFYFPSPEWYKLFQPMHLEFFRLFVILVSLAAVITLIIKTKNKLALMLLGFWLFFGVFLLGFYKKNIYDYLFTFIFPLPFLIIGYFLSQFFVWGKKKPQKIIAGIVGAALFTGIFFYNLSGNPFQYVPNRQKDQAKTISEFVLSQTNGKPYNFALISGGNSDHAYRYFLETADRPPVTIENPMVDPERKTVTDQLLIVCEDTSCQPLGHSLFEVAGYGRAEIVGEWNVSVVKVYKLVPYVEKEK
ncbi:MAG TPA: glycosyltransferase family 39 protein [Patescibacteria group bacterium]|nr:glycosyltransferase family 39 protein [Patescibacteria group bacterium]